MPLCSALPPGAPPQQPTTPARHRSAPCVARRWALCVVAAALIPSATVSAQVGTPALTGGVRGRVETAAHIPLVGAQLRLGAGTVITESDDTGQFSVSKVAAGPLWLRLRRIGYRPESLLVTVVAGQTIEPTVTMTPIAQNLAAVKVIGRRDVSGPMAGFYKRMQSGSGRYFTQADIERRNPNTMTDLLRTIPGLRIETRGFDNKVRIRGSRCSPLVWLDGQGLFAAEFDLDAVNPRTFEGIEVYSGPASVPMEFQGNARMSSSCGTIILWSRQGEFRTKKRKAGELTPTALVAQWLEERRIFTAADVDTEARPDSSKLIRPLYPDSLFDAQQAGEVLAEFVVDATGEAVMETFTAITTTHRSLVDPVRRAVRDQRFIPAVRKGTAVQQLLQLPFTFVPDSTARRRR